MQKAIVETKWPTKAQRGNVPCRDPYSLFSHFQDVDVLVVFEVIIDLINTSWIHFKANNMIRSAHKRTKSGLALSLLHRDRSKNEDYNDDRSSIAASDAGSPSGSPTTSAPSSHLPFGHLRPSRNKERGPGISTHDRAGPNTASTSAPNLTLKTQDASLTIEQSVKMFKMFEILRSGDNALIAKAVKDTSEMPPIEEDGEMSVTAPVSSSGALEGTTMLHLAIQCADPVVVEQILSVAKATPGAKVDINARDRDGNTPIHLASLLGRNSTVRILLEQPGINDTLRNYQGRSPLDLARTPEIFQQLQLSRSLFVDTKVKEIQALLAKGNYEGFESILEDPRVESVLDVNGGELATDPTTLQTGGTLLHEAARSKDTRLIQMLLMHGADPFRRDRKGKLPQDVTRDDKTRSILKKSPAAVAAQRGVQEKTILRSASSQAADDSPGGKDGREMKGYLKKWTNYTSGYKLRWFSLEDGILSYYKHQGTILPFP